MLPVTLDSFLAQDYPQERYEIIVADNNSTDNTREVTAQCAESSPVALRYIFEPRQGVHYARNNAAKQSAGEILYFTDDDMIADRSILMELVRVFDIDPMIGVATGLVKGKFESEPPGWVTKHMINSHLSLTDKIRQKHDLLISGNGLGVFSCHQAIKRKVFFEGGGFNPENTAGVWIGDGETGLSLKIEKLGYKFAYTSKSVTYHMIPPGRTTLKYLINRRGNQGFCDSYTEYRKHRSKTILLAKMLKRNVFNIYVTFLYTLFKVIAGRLSWHFIPARMFYYHKRNVYDLCLFTNKDFREMAEIDDWIENDFTIGCRLLKSLI